jgi:hypothetical protein
MSSGRAWVTWGEGGYSLVVELPTGQPKHYCHLELLLNCQVTRVMDLHTILHWGPPEEVVHPLSHVGGMDARLHIESPGQ